MSFPPVACANDGRVPTEEESLAPNNEETPFQNGPVSRFPDLPASVDLPSGPHGEEPAPGVPGFNANLKSSRGASAEGVVLRKEALQSLKLSLPMQETELCKHLSVAEPLLSLVPF